MGATSALLAEPNIRFEGGKLLDAIFFDKKNQKAHIILWGETENHSAYVIAEVVKGENASLPRIEGEPLQKMRLKADKDKDMITIKDNYTYIVGPCTQVTQDELDGDSIIKLCITEIESSQDKGHHEK